MVSIRRCARASRMRIRDRLARATVLRRVDLRCFYKKKIVEKTFDRKEVRGKEISSEDIGKKDGEKEKKWIGTDGSGE